MSTRIFTLFDSPNCGFQVEFLGIFIAILGAFTVVFSANTSETRLDRDALIEAITQKPFIIYSIVYIIGAFILTGLSASQRGRDWVFVDVGLCALFGTWGTIRVLRDIISYLTQEGSPCCRPKRSRRFLRWNG